MAFTVTYTAFSDSDPDSVWKTLMDIESWPSWDVRLKSTSSDGPLKPGSRYTLAPSHGNEVSIDVVKAENYLFHDVAKLELGTVETERTIEPVDGGCLIKQTMRADIKPDMTRTFGVVFWDAWSQGMIDSAKALANAHTAKREFASPENFDRLIAEHRNI
jgi:hypothetical protein